MTRILERSIISTDPYQYEGASKNELGYGDTQASSQYFDFISPETGQLTGVFVTEPKKDVSYAMDELAVPKRTIIYPQQHEYRNEPSSMARLQQMATAFDARVIGVETVGTVGLMRAGEGGLAEIYSEKNRLEGDRQTASQLTRALKGDFRPHATKQLEAIEGTVGMDTNTRYTLFGESMGAAVATDMLGLMKERGYNVDEVVLHEMVNAYEGVRPLAPIHLIRALSGEENNRRNQYIQENTDIGMAVGRSGALQASLDRYEKHEAPLLTLVRGRESLVTGDTEYRQFSTRFMLGGYAVRLFEVANGAALHSDTPIGHSHLFSLGRGKDIYDTLSQK